MSDTQVIHVGRVFPTDSRPLCGLGRPGIDVVDVAANANCEACLELARLRHEPTRVPLLASDERLRLERYTSGRWFICLGPAIALCDVKAAREVSTALAKWADEQDPPRLPVDQLAMLRRALTATHVHVSREERPLAKALERAGLVDIFACQGDEVFAVTAAGRAVLDSQ